MLKQLKLVPFGTHPIISCSPFLAFLSGAAKALDYWDVSKFIAIKTGKSRLVI
jgi:hypothetical protein